MLPEPHVWVFNAARASFPGGIFTTLERAEAWIAQHRLSGTLTAYPLDQYVLDWGESVGLFEPDAFDAKKEDPQFNGRFTSAYQEHYHYEDGVRP